MSLPEEILFGIELLGVVAFAISGVLAAAEKQLDPFGAVVLGLAAAMGGGALRDVLLDINPIMMFARPIYSILAVGVSAVTAVFLMLWHATPGGMARLEKATDIVDSVGLSVFVISGARAAMTAGYADNGFIVVFVGVITGIGGGILRDVLANRLPVVLHKRVYALAALAGSLVFFLLSHAMARGYLPTVAGAGTVLVIRFLAVRYRWNIPRLKAYK